MNPQNALNHETAKVKVYLLLGQKKYDLAEQQVRGLVGASPDDHELYGLLADSLLGQSRYGEALGAAEQALQIEPSDPVHRYRIAIARLNLGESAKALATIDEAISTSPRDADLHSIRAQTLVTMDREAEALQAAEAGLEIDPMHAGCRTARAMALHGQGNASAARQHLLEQLATNPNDDVVHYQLGHTFLMDGDHERAADHFRESLRVDPTSSAARQGLISALQARNTTFALLLRFGYWLSTLPKWAPWVGVIALLAAPRLVRTLTGDGAVVRALANFVVIVVVIVSQLAMCADAFFMLMLRFDRKSRGMLTPAQRRTSNWQAVSMLLMGLTLLAWPLLGRLSLIAGLGTFAMLTTNMPCLFQPALPKNRRRVALALAVAVLCGLVAMILMWPVSLLVLILLGLSFKHVLYTGAALVLAGWYFFDRAERTAEQLVQEEQYRGIIRSEFE